MYLLRSMVSHGDRCLDRSVNEHKLRRDARRSGDPLSTFTPYDSLSGCPQGKREREKERDRKSERTASHRGFSASVFFSRLRETLRFLPFVLLPSFLGEDPGSGIFIARTRRRSRVQDRGQRQLEDSVDEFRRDAFFFFFPAVLLSSKTKHTRDQHARYTTRREPHQLRITADSRSLRIQIQIETAAHVRRPRLISCSIVASASVSSEILRYVLLYQIESYDVDENKLPY